MARAWKITYTIRDARGHRSKLSYWYGDSHQNNFFDFYTPWEIAEIGATVLDPQIDGAIEAINVSFDMPLPPGLKSLPLDNSNVEEGALVTYRVLGGGFFQHRIPTLKENLIPREDPNFRPGGTVNFVNFVGFPEEYTMGGAGLLGPSDMRGNDILGGVKMVSDFTKERRER